MRLISSENHPSQVQEPASESGRYKGAGLSHGGSQVIEGSARGMDDVKDPLRE
jgi:hypothetical protein